MQGPEWSASISAATLVNGAITDTSPRPHGMHLGLARVAGDDSGELGLKHKQGLFKKLVNKLKPSGSSRGSSDVGTKCTGVGRSSEDTCSNSAASQLSCPSVNNQPNTIRYSEEGVLDIIPQFTSLQTDRSVPVCHNQSTAADTLTTLGRDLQSTATQQAPSMPVQPGLAMLPVPAGGARTHTASLETSPVCNTESNSDWDMLGAGSSSQAGQLTLAQALPVDAAQQGVVAASSLYEDAHAFTDRMARYSAGAMHQSWGMDELQASTNSQTAPLSQLKPSQQPWKGTAGGSQRISAIAPAAATAIDASLFQQSASGGPSMLESVSSGVRSVTPPSRSLQTRASEELTRKIAMIQEQVANLTDEELLDPRSTSRVQLFSAMQMSQDNLGSATAAQSNLQGMVYSGSSKQELGVVVGEAPSTDALGRAASQTWKLHKHAARTPLSVSVPSLTDAVAVGLPATPPRRTEAGTTASRQDVVLAEAQGVSPAQAAIGSGLLNLTVDLEHAQQTPHNDRHAVVTFKTLTEEKLLVPVGQSASSKGFVGEDGMELLTHPPADVQISARIFQEELSPAGVVNAAPGFEFMLGTVSKSSLGSSKAHAAAHQQAFPVSMGGTMANEASARPTTRVGSSPGGSSTLLGLGTATTDTSGPEEAPCVLEGRLPSAIDRTTSQGWPATPTNGVHTDTANSARTPTWHEHSSRTTPGSQPGVASITPAAHSTRSTASKFSVTAALGQFTGTGSSAGKLARKSLPDQAALAPTASPTYQPTRTAVLSQLGVSERADAARGVRASMDRAQGASQMATWPAPSVARPGSASPLGRANTPTVGKHSRTAAAPSGSVALPGHLPHLSHKFDLAALGSGVLLIQSVESLESAAAQQQAAAQGMQASSTRTSLTGSASTSSANALQALPAPKAVARRESSTPSPSPSETPRAALQQQQQQQQGTDRQDGGSRVNRSCSVPCLHQQPCSNNTMQPQEQAGNSRTGHVPAVTEPALHRVASDSNVPDHPHPMQASQPASVQGMQHRLARSAVELAAGIVDRAHSQRMLPGMETDSISGRQSMLPHTVRNAEEKTQLQQASAQGKGAQQQSPQPRCQLQEHFQNLAQSFGSRSSGLLCDTQHSSSGMGGGSCAGGTVASLFGTSQLSAITSSYGPILGGPESDRGHDSAAHNPQEDPSRLVHGLRTVLLALSSMGYDAQDTAVISQVCAALSTLPRMAPEPTGSWQQEKDEQQRCRASGLQGVQAAQGFISSTSKGTQLAGASSSGTPRISSSSGVLEDLPAWLQFRTQSDMPLGSNTSVHLGHSDDEEIPTMVPDETGMMVAVPRSGSTIVRRPRQRRHSRHYTSVSSIKHRRTSGVVLQHHDIAGASSQQQHSKAASEASQGRGDMATPWQGRMARGSSHGSLAAHADVSPRQEDRRWLYMAGFGGAFLVLMNLMCMVVALYTMREVSRH